jgi:chromate transporter
MGLALAAFGLLALWRAPAWLVVLFAAGGGALIPLVAR